MSNDTKYYLEDSFDDLEFAQRKLNRLDEYKDSLSPEYVEETKKTLLDLIDTLKKSIAKIHLEEL